MRNYLAFSYDCTEVCDNGEVKLADAHGCTVRQTYWFHKWVTNLSAHGTVFLAIRNHCSLNFLWLAMLWDNYPSVKHNFLEIKLNNYSQIVTKNEVFEFLES
jgi:hypothetical protein